VIIKGYDDEGSFWQQRLKAVGHTGRLDRKAYVFDQMCRLRVFETWLESKVSVPGTAFDFGCGVGDFARLLNRRGWSVIGCDKFITPNYRAPSFRFINAIENGSSVKNVNLILSVTTLDHILDNVAFMKTLKRLSNMLCPDGYFFFLECSPVANLKRSSYQAFRSMSEWMSALGDAGLSVTETTPFFDPVNAPVPAWSIYENMLITRIGSRCEQKKYLHYGSRLLYNVAAKTCLRARPYEPPAASTINIIGGNKV